MCYYCLPSAFTTLCFDVNHAGTNALTRFRIRQKANAKANTSMLIILRISNIASPPTAVKTTTAPATISLIIVTPK